MKDASPNPNPNPNRLVPILAKMKDAASKLRVFSGAQDSVLNFLSFDMYPKFLSPPVHIHTCARPASLAVWSTLVILVSNKGTTFFSAPNVRRSCK